MRRRGCRDCGDLVWFSLGARARRSRPAGRVTFICWHVWTGEISNRCARTYRTLLGRDRREEKDMPWQARAVMDVKQEFVELTRRAEALSFLASPLGGRACVWNRAARHQ